MQRKEWDEYVEGMLNTTQVNIGNEMEENP